MVHLLQVLLAAPLYSGAIAHSERFGTVVASDNVIRVVNAGGATTRRAPGVAHPSLAIVSDDGATAAIVDSLENVVVEMDLSTGGTRRHVVAETPVAAAFMNRDLYILSRDARKLTRIADGATTSVEVARDSSQLRTANRFLYVYSRAEGTLAEFSPDLLLQRTARVDAYASDLEIDDRHAYLVYPRTGQLVAVALATWTVVDRIDIGATPVDMILERDPNALTSGTIAIADPSSKRVWRVPRSDSPARAFGRAFLRGFLGFGASTESSVKTPTGIDRLWRSGEVTFGYDSANHVLYRLDRKTARRVASDELVHFDQGAVHPLQLF